MRFFSPDTTFYNNYIDKGKYTLVWRLSLLFCFMFGLLAIGGYFYDKRSSLIYCIVFVIAFSGFLYLIRWRNYHHIFWSFTVGATSVVLITINDETGLIHYADFCWIFAVIIFAFIGLGRKIGMVFILVFGVGIAYHMFFWLNLQVVQIRQHSVAEITGISVEMIFAMFTVGYLLHQYLIFQSYAESQLIQANTELELQNSLISYKNEENSILVKEVHHRVKNNLQIIISLLRMHRDEVNSEETYLHFSEAINRILAMALIHQKLYKEKELSRVDIKSYFQELSHEILNSTKKADQSIDIRFDVQISTVDLDTVVPFGLILNELITNSMKHAFSTSKTGTIMLELIPLNAYSFKFRYSDDGIWIDDEHTQRGFGQELMYLLAAQMGGNLERSGSAYEIEVAHKSE